MPKKRSSKKRKKRKTAQNSEPRGLVCDGSVKGGAYENLVRLVDRLGVDGVNHGKLRPF